MATVHQDGTRLIIAVTDEEAKNLQPGDTVRIIKIDNQSSPQSFDEITEKVLRDFAADIDYLKDK